MTSLKPMTRLQALFPAVVRSAKNCPRVFSLPTVLAATLLVSSGGATPIVLAQSVSQPTTAQTTTGNSILYVKPDIGADSPQAGTSQAAPFRTITYALKQAKPGTVVQLSPGLYTPETGEVFPLIVPKGVNLRGEESNQGLNVGIVGGDSYLSQSEGRQNVGVVASDGSTIAGVTIVNTKIRGTGLWVEFGSPIIKSNTFINNSREGIFITGRANPTIENNAFVKNKGNGITVSRRARGQITNNVFENTGFGIAVSEVGAPVIAQNRIAQNIDGIVLSGGSAPLIRNNSIENNQRDGIVAIKNAQPDLGTQSNPGQNEIRSNGRYDINNSTSNQIFVAFGNNLPQQKCLFGRLSFEGAPTSPAFSDIQNHWAQPYIEALASQNLLAGSGDGTFRPNETLNRAQLAAMIDKAFAPTPKQAAVSFSDVNNKFWAYQSIQRVSQSGFLSAFPKKQFRPNQTVTRVGVIVALVNGLKLGSKDAKLLAVYVDKEQIPASVSKAVAAATEKELVVNYPDVGKLNPNRNVSRAEAAAFIYRALLSTGRVKAICSPFLVKSTDSNAVRNSEVQQPTSPGV
jgi:parallel beta-helix repeat protein